MERNLFPTCTGIKVGYYYILAMMLNEKRQINKAELIQWLVVVL